MSALADFKDKFGFNPKKNLLVGVEREFFLADRAGRVLPLIEKILPFLPDDGRFGFELSACQLESRTKEDVFSRLKSRLWANEKELEKAERKAGVQRLCVEVGPPDMPLAVYPDKRYLAIKKSLPIKKLRAACRVIGTHIHIGLPDHETALKVYNRAIRYSGRLLSAGDGSNGKRLALYKIVAPQCDPRPYKNWADFFQFAQTNGFAEEPRNCWHLIRLSKHGTIEFRLFGATANLDKIILWADMCREICEQPG